MKRLIILSLLTLFTASCWPISPADQASRSSLISQSFQCMWNNNCSK
jgi:hypothetical protein